MFPSNGLILRPETQPGLFCARPGELQGCRNDGQERLRQRTKLGGIKCWAVIPDHLNADVHFPQALESDPALVSSLKREIGDSETSRIFRTEKLLLTGSQFPLELLTPAERFEHPSIEDIMAAAMRNSLMEDSEEEPVVIALPEPTNAIDTNAPPGPSFMDRLLAAPFSLFDSSSASQDESSSRKSAPTIPVTASPASSSSPSSVDKLTPLPSFLDQVLSAPGSLLESSESAVSGLVVVGEETLEVAAVDLGGQRTISGSFLLSVADALHSFEILPPLEQLQLALAGALLYVYLTARPGVLAGAVDSYLMAPLQVALDSVRGRRSFKRTDFVLGKRMGEGNFGTVFEAGLMKNGLGEEESFGRRSVQLAEVENMKGVRRVVLKKVNTRTEGGVESGDMEEWFNRRMQRVAPEACAKFLGSFVADTTRGQFLEGGKWLVWDYEGELTLDDYLRDRNFPDNLEDLLFGSGRVLLQPLSPVSRQVQTIKQVLRQVIISLKKAHATGIVHRDVKPSNLVITSGGRVKLIDFGAAADLRIGMNYRPDLAMLDPDYCAPEQYVMPEETPFPPIPPVAALLSPLLWQANHPDLFDMYSVGIILLQMCVPSLRTKMGLQQFKQEILKARFNLKRWRRDTRMRPDLTLLDADGGRGWDLATKLVCERGNFFPKVRLSAAEALRHPYFLLGADEAATALSRLTLSR